MFSDVFTNDRKNCGFACWIVSATSVVSLYVRCPARGLDVQLVIGATSVEAPDRTESCTSSVTVTVRLVLSHSWSTPMVPLSSNHWTEPGT